MLLSPAEGDRFLKLYKALLIHVNQRFQLVKGVATVTDLENEPLEETLNLREKLYQHPTLFDEFIQNQLAEADTQTIETVSGWKNFVQGEFYLFRYLKKYAIFLTMDSPYKAYGVMALTTPFDEMIDPQMLPTIVRTVLLPFDGKIVCDGFIQGANILFGAGMRSSVNTAYEEAKARFGIITSLDTPIQETESADAAKLRAYLKTDRNREEYWYEIQSLKDKTPELQLIYAQEMGKAYAKKHSKRWKEIGLKNVWFALFEEMPIASGKTKADVEAIIREILPSSQQSFVYFFQLKGK